MFSAQAKNKPLKLNFLDYPYQTWYGKMNVLIHFARRTLW